MYTQKTIFYILVSSVLLQLTSCSFLGIQLFNKDIKPYKRRFKYYAWKCSENKDKLYVGLVFEKYFNDDTIKIFVNDTLNKELIISTSRVTGRAAITEIKSKAPINSLKIKINDGNIRYICLKKEFCYIYFFKWKNCLRVVMGDALNGLAG